MIKKLLCLILIISCFFTAVPVTGVAADDTMATLVSLVDRFPHGKYWNHVGSRNNPDGITNTPCASHRNCHWAANSCNCNSFDNAIQCMGYAHKISYEITGVSPRNNYVKSKTLKASNLRVGDIIRYRWDGHSICVTGVKGNKISFTDCNFIGRCQIRWGVMDISKIQGFTYVLHLSGNDRKNSDLEFYENLDGYKTEINPEDNNEIWRMNDNVLNLRSHHSTDAHAVGKIPVGAEFQIYDKYYDGTYMWGKVAYRDLVGWCALNYAEYVSGVIERPNFRNANESYVSGKKFELSWKEVTGATKYWLYICNSKGETVKKYVLKGDEPHKDIKIKTKGEYSAKVIATSSVTPSWKIASKEYSFRIIGADEKIYVKALEFSAPDKIAKGTQATAEVSVTPASASDCGVKWKSSDPKIASVNSKGKITAKKFGTVTITCTAADRGIVQYSKTVTVVPDTVENIKQKSSTSTKVKLSWDKVEGATLYAIYKFNSETREYEKITNCKKNTYTMKTDPGTTTKIKVHALAKVGSKYYYSAPSDIFAAVTGPEAPTLKVSVWGDKATFRWSEVEGATHYVLYRVHGDKVKKIATESAEDTDFKYVIDDMEAGSYTYKIRPIRKVGNVKGYGAYSKTASFIVK